MVMDVSLICQSTLNVSTSVLIFPHAKIYDVLRVGEVTHTNAKTLMNVFNPLIIVQVEDPQIYRCILSSGTPTESHLLIL